MGCARGVTRLYVALWMVGAALLAYWAFEQTRDTLDAVAQATAAARKYGISVDSLAKHHAPPSWPPLSRLDPQFSLSAAERALQEDAAVAADERVSATGRHHRFVWAAWFGLGVLVPAVVLFLGKWVARGFAGTGKQGTAKTTGQSEMGGEVEAGACRPSERCMGGSMNRKQLAVLWIMALGLSALSVFYGWTKHADEETGLAILFLGVVPLGLLGCTLLCSLRDKARLQGRSGQSPTTGLMIILLLLQVCALGVLWSTAQAVGDVSDDVAAVQSNISDIETAVQELSYGR